MGYKRSAPAQQQGHRKSLLDGNQQGTLSRAIVEFVRAIGVREVMVTSPLLKMNPQCTLAFGKLMGPSYVLAPS